MQNRIGSGWSNNMNATVDGKNPLGAKFAPMRWNAVGAEYFRTRGTPIRYGRDISDADTEVEPKVAIINETFVERYLPNQNPLGHQIAISANKNAPQYTIAGVASNSKYTGVREKDPPMAYFPYKQTPGISAMHVELRTAGNPLARLPEGRRG